ncbi:hypothetical protein R69927_04275 [Paraburkholderia domus]|jgi:hypothetical protein|uniref:Uncharacterized protein n=1 Tax=Paraburkholderia domus TaxID=2793075 RepID=A0A9N8N5D1_9BURK|nr:hypothetical protein R75483_05777 [Paraburkholderia domus]CAE6818821.1 hypothetical protein R70006_06100 [Paraburkholderia domus]CAE6865095.1 hypothetical protein R69749_05708 [Paraburkholderia domus]CAE6881471.1 hypothetical protein R69927_04275 [Paraburkholderia domus]CAE6921271.1 hypothetical protein R70199_04901 [Paraburkholderia domus]
MSYQDIDNEIAHFELVFGKISPNDRIPLSYWRNRLDMLPETLLMPTQRARLARLDATLRALELSANTPAAEEPPRAVLNRSGSARQAPAREPAASPPPLLSETS